MLQPVLQRGWRQSALVAWFFTASCEGFAPRWRPSSRGQPLGSSTVGTGFEGKAETATFLEIPWDELDLPKYGVPLKDRELLRAAYEELPEGDLVPKYDPTSVEDLTPEEVLEEIEQHKAMLAYQDHEENVSHAVKCEVTGEMVEWFDEEVVERKLEYWEVDEKEDPRFQVSWPRVYPQSYVRHARNSSSHLLPLAVSLGHGPAARLQLSESSKQSRRLHVEQDPRPR